MSLVSPPTNKLVDRQKQKIEKRGKSNRNSQKAG